MPPVPHYACLYIGFSVASRIYVGMFTIRQVDRVRSMSQTQYIEIKFKGIIWYLILVFFFAKFLLLARKKKLMSCIRAIHPKIVL